MMLTASVSRKRKDDSAYRSQCFIVVPVDLNLPERIQENQARFWIPGVALPALYLSYSRSRSIIDPKEIIVRSKRDPRIAPACAVTGFNVCLDRLRNVKC